MDAGNEKWGTGLLKSQKGSICSTRIPADKLSLLRSSRASYICHLYGIS